MIAAVLRYALVNFGPVLAFITGICSPTQSLDDPRRPGFASSLSTPLGDRAHAHLTRLDHKYDVEPGDQPQLRHRRPGDLGSHDLIPDLGVHQRMVTAGHHVTDGRPQRGTWAAMRRIEILQSSPGDRADTHFTGLA